MDFTPTQLRLLAARVDAVERGDKALGREIYHQLQESGLQGHQIDGWVAAPPEPEPAREVAEPEQPWETADAEPAPERAVHRRGRRG